MLELSVAQTISEVEERLYLQFLVVPVTYNAPSRYMRTRSCFPNDKNAGLRSTFFGKGIESLPGGLTFPKRTPDIAFPVS